MSIAVPEEMREFVEREIASGKFRSEEEMVTAGLRLLRAREMQADALRADLLEGVADLEEGNGQPAGEVFRRLRERAAELSGRD